MAARITGVPQPTYLLQGLRLEGSSGMQRRILALFERIASFCSHRVATVSPLLASEFERLGLNSGRAVVVPHHGSSHGVDTEHFIPQPRDAELAANLDLVADVPVVVFIGRRTADKGPDTLIRGSRPWQSATDRCSSSCSAPRTSRTRRSTPTPRADR